LSSKRIVITGGPGTGKTSIINELKNKGYSCFEEISREVIAEARKSGIDQLFLTHPLLFSELLLKGRVTQFIESNNSHSEFVFLDRGIPDVIAYMDYIGDSYPKIFEASCREYTYDYIFILAPWPEIYVTDSERYETFEQAVTIYHKLLNTYSKFQYNILEVPFCNVEERADYILKKIK